MNGDVRVSKAVGELFIGRTSIGDDEATMRAIVAELTELDEMLDRVVANPTNRVVHPRVVAGWMRADLARAAVTHGVDDPIFASTEILDLLERLVRHARTSKDTGR